MAAKKKKAPAKFLYGGPDDERFSAKSAHDYLHDRWADLPDPAVGEIELVAKYERKDFALEVFQRAISSTFDDIVSYLEDEYAVDDTIGLEDLEDDFAEEAGLVLVRLARANCVPAQCDLVEVQEWKWDGAKWVRP